MPLNGFGRALLLRRRLRMYQRLSREWGSGAGHADALPFSILPMTLGNMRELGR